MSRAYVYMAISFRSSDFGDILAENTNASWRVSSLAPSSVHLP